MTETRHFAGWLRSFTGLLAVAGALGLSACGGGSGAPNNPFLGTLTVLPATAVAYSGVPTTLTISGGTGPYRAFSSNPTVLAVSQTVPAKSVVLLTENVDVDTDVTITIQDAAAAEVQIVVTVRPAPLINSLTLKADGFTDVCPNPGGSASATDSAAQTFICAGQTGSVAVRLKNTVGGGLAGRQIRFEVVQGDFQLFTNAPGQPPTFALSYTVPTDQNGDAIARVHALPNSSHQIVIVQATDLLTGTFVRGIFIVTNGDGLLIVPDKVTITGPDSETCSAGVGTSFFIFGGLPPYTISNTFPQFLAVSPSIVLASGSGFNVLTVGGCVDPAIIAITDSAGHTKTVEVKNLVGTKPPATVVSNNPIIISPGSIPTLTCLPPTSSTNIALGGGGTTSTSGSTSTVTPATTFLLSTNRPDILTINPPNPAPLAPVTLTRGPGTVSGNASSPSITLSVFDGNQTRTVSVPTSPATCP